MPILEKPKPIPIKERASFAFVGKGCLDVLDGAFVMVDESGIRTQIPVGGLTSLFLEPGSRVSHAAVGLAARVGCLLVWVGEAGVRTYSAGQPGGARSDRLLHQAATALDEQARLRVVRKMYEMRFGEPAPSRRSVDQLRGIEGSRVRETYRMLAAQHSVKWKGRKYDVRKWDASDVVNRCLSEATASLYGLCEAAILAAGYAPAIGFIHTGKPRSFVYDIADIHKFNTVVPIAFRIAAEVQTGRIGRGQQTGAVRRACRDSFRSMGILREIVPSIEEIIASGGLPVPKPASDTMPIAIAEPTSGDAGHRG